MNKTGKRVLSVVLCAALCTGGVSVALAQPKTAAPQVTITAESLTPVADTETQDVTKDETVYVLSAADGTVEKIIVSDWLQNALGSAAITDETQLSDIENVKGDETYAANSSGQVWSADGGDIYYQGTIEKSLPVDMAVSYTLNGQSITPDALAGQSGKVTIRFDYENRQFEWVNVGGRSEKIYVPFAMLTGLLLDNDCFRNVTVSNGKLINDGDHTIVVGLAFPGLQENLSLSRDKVDIPDYVEITADVTDFALNMTVTVATNQVFNELDTDDIDADDLSASLDELTDGMEQLMDGSSQLYDGLCTLLKKSGELSDGVGELYSGAYDLRAGAKDLDDGAATLKTKLAELSTGLATLSGQSSTLNSGAAQVFNTLLSTAQSQLTAVGLDVPTLTITNYGTTLSAVIASLDEDAVYASALAQVTAAVEQNRPTITAAVTYAVQADVQSQVMQAAGVTQAQYDGSDAVKVQIDTAVAAQMQSDTVRSLIAQNTESQIQALIAQNMASDAVQSQLTAASAGAQSVIALKTSLDSYNAFYQGVLVYTAGTDTAAAGAAALSDGAAELKSGTAELYDGTKRLYSGVAELKKNMPDLLSGVRELRDGSMELSDGLKKLNEEGIEKIVELAEGDLQDVADRLEATIDVSRRYRSFAGISDDMAGQVKFLYRTNEIS